MRKEFIVLSYDVNRYPFRKTLETHVFKVPQLEQMHLVWKKQAGKEELNYNDNLVLRKIMQDLRDEAAFYKIYHKFFHTLRTFKLKCFSNSKSSGLLSNQFKSTSRKRPNFFLEIV